jgi:hypothetical protein
MHSLAQSVVINDYDLHGLSNRTPDFRVISKAKLEVPKIGH